MSRALRWTLRLLASALLVYGLLFAWVWRVSRRDERRPADAIVVLGAAQYNGRPSPVLKARLDHAVELYRAIPTSALWVVPNGGHGPIFGDQAGPFVTTAAAFLG